MAAHEVSSDPATASNTSVHPSVSALKDRQIMALKGFSMKEMYLFIF